MPACFGMAGMYVLAVPGGPGALCLLKQKQAQKSYLREDIKDTLGILESSSAINDVCPWFGKKITGLSIYARLPSFPISNLPAKTITNNSLSIAID
jgi:hypothetical protein